MTILVKTAHKALKALCIERERLARVDELQHWLDEYHKEGNLHPYNDSKCVSIDVLYEDFEDRLEALQADDVEKATHSILTTIVKRLPEKGWRLKSIGRKTPRDEYIMGYNEAISDIKNLLEGVDD